MNRPPRGSPAMDPASPGGELELVWRGKYDDDGRRVRVVPRDVTLETLEVHAPRRDAAPDAASGDAGRGGDTSPSMLVWGDNLDALDAWRTTHRGAVDLAYIDPPFLTGTTFDVTTRLRDPEGQPHVITQPAYSDRWSGGASAYLAMLAPRIERIHELLAPHGSLYLHVDPTISHVVRLLVDEIFGSAAFQREIVWRIGWVSGFKTRARNWIRNHDTILFYAKDPQRMRFNKLYVAHPEGYTRRAGVAAKAPGMAIDDVWNAGAADLALVGSESLDSIQIKSFSREKTGYATQKNQSLLRRIIGASSDRGDLVLDAFGGAGTTALVAAQMHRRFLTCDMGEPAVQLSRARLLADAPKASWCLAATSPMVPPRRAARVERTGDRSWRVVASLASSAPDSREASPDTATLDVACDPGRWRIEVVGVAFGSPSESVQQGIAAGVDPLLEIAIDWAATDGPLRPSARTVASDAAPLVRVLESSAAASRIAVVLVDVTHRRTRIDLEIRDGGRPELTAFAV